MRRIRILAAALAAAVLVAPARAAPSWHFAESENGMRAASIWAQGRTPSGQVPMKLEVRCRPGPDGAATIALAVRGAQDMRAFSFEDFEGADAPAARRKLATIRVVALRRDVSVTTSFAGGYQEDGFFAFTLSAPLVGRNEVKWITDAIILGAVLVVVTVQDPRDSRRRIHAQFQTRGATAAVTNTMDGCLAAAVANGAVRPQTR